MKVKVNISDNPLEPGFFNENNCEQEVNSKSEKQWNLKAQMLKRIFLDSTPQNLEKGAMRVIVSTVLT